MAGFQARIKWSNGPESAKSSQSAADGLERQPYEAKIT